ncbi:hypothetical protein OAN96_01630 [Candidatus Gracilibacteria bacterium]|nr:hypothetical protein [Candidatus Gracilibacteria bacterium]
MKLESKNFDNQINDLEKILKDASSLREVTYGYVNIGGKKQLNKTVLLDFCEIDIFKTGDSISQEDIKNYVSNHFSGDNMSFIKSLKATAEDKLSKNIIFLEQHLENDEVEDVETIKTLVATLNFTLNGLDFECEKAGLNHELSNEEIEQKTQKQYQYDAILFGEHVGDDSDFLLDTYAYLTYLLDKHSETLKPSQISGFKQHLESILGQLDTLGVESYEVPTYVPEPKDEFLEKLKTVKIDRETYTGMFNNTFEIADISQRAEIGNYSFFYDGDDQFGIPKAKPEGEKDNYATKSVEELLRLFAHETTHYINYKETHSKGGKKRPLDIIKEEGLAMLVEKLISGVGLDDMNYMTFAGPNVAMGKILDGKQYNDFQTTYSQLLLAEGEIGEAWNIKARGLRSARGFSKDHPGSTNKDSSYPLGFKLVLDHVKSGGSIASLFGGKISMDDVKSGNFDPADFGNEYVNHIISTELTLFYLKNQGKHQGDNKHEAFVSYLKEKYSDLSDFFDVFTEAQKFTLSQAKKTMQIIKPMQQAIDSNDSQNQAA